MESSQGTLRVRLALQPCRCYTKPVHIRVHVPHMGRVVCATSDWPDHRRDTRLSSKQTSLVSGEPEWLAPSSDCNGSQLRLPLTSGGVGEMCIERLHERGDQGPTTGLCRLRRAAGHWTSDLVLR